MEHPVFGKIDSGVLGSFSSVGFQEAEATEPALAAKPRVNRQFIMGKSRFIEDVEVPNTWFTKSWEDFNAKTLESNTPQVLHIESEDKKSFNDSIQTTIDEMSRFIVEDLTPINLCFKSAVDKAYETIGLMMEGVKIEKPDTSKFTRICSDLTLMKFIKHVATSSNLDDSEKQILIDKYVSKHELP